MVVVAMPNTLLFLSMLHLLSEHVLFVNDHQLCQIMLREALSSLTKLKKEQVTFTLRNPSRRLLIPAQRQAL